MESQHSVTLCCSRSCACMAEADLDKWPLLRAARDGSLLSTPVVVPAAASACSLLFSPCGSARPSHEGFSLMSSRDEQASSIGSPPFSISSIACTHVARRAIEQDAWHFTTWPASISSILPRKSANDAHMRTRLLAMNRGPNIIGAENPV